MDSRPALLRRGLWAAVAALGLIVVALTVRAAYEPERSTGGPVLGEPLGGSFALVDQNGQTVTDEDLRGKPTAMFFGYTSCPDVCPTTMLEMSNWIKELGDDAGRANFVFVTVDPERDTPQVLHDYIGAFSERIVGLTGEPEAVEDMLDSYKVFRERVEEEGGRYSVSHTGSVFFLDAGGRLRGIFPFGGDAEVAVKKLDRLIHSEGA